MLSEFKTREDFVASAARPKVFLKRITAAGGPAAKKLLLVSLRRKLEPRFAAMGVQAPCPDCPISS